MRKPVRLFIRDYLKELREDNAAVFAGAGLSAPAGFVDWLELLRPLADDLGLKVELETDLVALAQFALNQSAGNRHRINQLLIEQLDVAAEPTSNHRLLAELPIRAFWTTNYDRLIEDALRISGKVVDVKYSIEHLATTKPRRDSIVYKMHGDIQDPHKAVLVRDDYERYPHDRPAFITALSGDMISKTFLFLGFSFSDPNLNYVLSRIRVWYRENQRRHFAFFRNRTRESQESEEEFLHAQVRQQLMIQDLQRFNVQPLLVDEYSEITEALQELVRLYRIRTIFVSGSVTDPSPWEREQVELFLRELGDTLVKRGNHIITGLGLGVGIPLISGVVERVQKDRKIHLDDVLTVRPFPLSIPNSEDRKRVYSEYRQQLVDRAGVCLFIFGNKVKDGALGPATGVLEEFRIAREAGRVLIPVGATGMTAQLLWREMRESLESYFPKASGRFKEAFNRVGNSELGLQNLVPAIMQILDLIEEGDALTD